MESKSQLLRSLSIIVMNEILSRLHSILTLTLRLWYIMMESIKQIKHCDLCCFSVNLSFSLTLAHLSELHKMDGLVCAFYCLLCSYWFWF